MYAKMWRTIATPSCGPYICTSDPSLTESNTPIKVPESASNHHKWRPPFPMKCLLASQEREPSLQKNSVCPLIKYTRFDGIKHPKMGEVAVGDG